MIESLSPVETLVVVGNSIVLAAALLLGMRLAEELLAGDPQ